ncbi:hypothetical protein FA13DRAFT_1260153 [Coprinellus micaceus]|uniref:GH18 domain-containing protein n=1 Tax=Coprinellus micaceus TaxID=71717 RepID=A0A4Y7STD0_COPMI|nr:hypothetical protein FA13DRAFT_1260153 [Coprinellus micaceus]
MALSDGLGRNVLLALMLLNALLATHATQIMRRPNTYKTAARKFTIESSPQILTVGKRDVNTTAAAVDLNKRATGKASFAYFTNWGIYGANFQPTDIVTSGITHILYSFADTNPSTGNIILTDPYADEQKHFPGDSWSDTGNNLYGCLKQLYLLKLQKRDLKVLLSIGGWTYSQAGHFNFVTSSAARTTFINDALKLVEDYGFDGIDIDYEYPASAAQGQGLADLVTSLRTAFTNLASRKSDTVPYFVTAAVGAGPTGYSYLNIKQMNAALDYWNLMAYDYAGSWLNYVDNQANVYGGARTGFSTDAALTYYLNNGASASKINIGIPLYGRAYENTDGLGKSYSGIGPGTIEAGVYSYKALPLAGASVYQNKTDVTSYSYDSVKREFVSYDTPSIAKMKALYAVNKGLAGTMFWELSQDKVGSESLISSSAEILGSLDTTQNHIKYASSKWDNVRNNMNNPGTSTSTTNPGTTPTGAPGSGACAGVAAWSSTTVYWGGDKATYSGRLWTAKWWTQNETPGGSSGVWDNTSAC